MTGKGQFWREVFSAITETGVQEARTHYRDEWAEGTLKEGK